MSGDAGRSSTFQRPVIDDITSFDRDVGSGNLIGIQPYMQPLDYATAERFYTRMEGYLEATADQGWLGGKSIVIFPEHIGTWLAALDLPAAVYDAPTLDQGIRGAILPLLPRLTLALPKAVGRDRLRDGLFRSRARRMAQVYHETFEKIARLYEVTIVAGSILLPEPVVLDGELQTGEGPLQNVSAVYAPDGGIHKDLVRKAHLVSDEALFASGSSAAELPVFETPAGRLGVLICADAWYPSSYAGIERQRPDLVAVPNFERPTWDAPWPGYDPGPPPDDVDSGDPGRLTNRDAWIKYALGGRMRLSGAVAGMQVFFHGQMWEMRGYGQTIAVTRQGVRLAEYVDGAALANLWISR